MPKFDVLVRFEAGSVEQAIQALDDSDFFYLNKTIISINPAGREEKSAQGLTKEYE